MSVSEAARSGSRLDALIALRDRLAAEIDACESSRDVAALSRQFTDVLTAIELVKAGVPEEKGTALDEFSKRLAERRSRTAG